MPGQISKYHLIDGQQRLTTLSLVLCALRDAATAAGFAELAQEITFTTLEHQFKKGTDRYRLFPKLRDRDQYVACLAGAAARRGAPRRGRAVLLGPADHDPRRGDRGRPAGLLRPAHPAAGVHLRPAGGREPVQHLQEPELDGRAPGPVRPDPQLRLHAGAGRGPGRVRRDPLEADRAAVRGRRGEHRRRRASRPSSAIT